MTQTPTTSRTLFRQKKRLIFVLMAFLAAGIFWWLFGRGTTQEPNLVENDTNSPKVYTPVNYPVDGWQAQAKLVRPFADDGLLIKLVGAAATRHEGLDVNGSIASLYRFHSTYEAPIYVIDSDEFFELSWYYADPKDSDDDKKASLHYAQKAYGVATAILGETEGKILLDNTLNQNVINAASTQAKLPTGVYVAHCQDYLCRLVFVKAEFS